MLPISMDDNQILDFYLKEKAANSDIFQRYLKEKQLKEKLFPDGSNIFEEAKRTMRIMKNDIHKRNPHLRKVQLLNG